MIITKTQCILYSLWRFYCPLSWLCFFKFFKFVYFCICHIPTCQSKKQNKKYIILKRKQIKIHRWSSHFLLCYLSFLPFFGRDRMETRSHGGKIVQRSTIIPWRISGPRGLAFSQFCNMMRREPEEERRKKDSRTRNWSPKEVSRKFVESEPGKSSQPWQHQDPMAGFR